MPIFVFLHVATMFVAVAVAYGPTALLIAATRRGDVLALRSISGTYNRLGERVVGPLFGVGVLFGVIAIFAHGFDPLQGWLVIAYVLLILVLIVTFGFTTPWMNKLQAAAEASPDDRMSPELAQLLGSPRNRLLLAVDAGLIIAIIADMVLKPLPGRII
jgi:hypothetical protein